MSLAEPLQQIDRTYVLHRGRKLSYFGGCDYFRMSSHPAVLKALAEGTRKFGLNVAASRTTTGNHELFGQLEKELARFFGVESAILLSNGYATNLAFAQSFADHFIHAIMDDRSHGSLTDAAALLNAPVRFFRHQDPVHAKQQLGRSGKNARPLFLTDGLFAHDGSLAPLEQYLDALPRSGMLLVDDAHGAGTIGRNGRGTPEVCGVSDPRLVQTISLSKAFGVYGGAILGTETIIGQVREQSRIFRGNTPPPLPLVNAALASLKVLNANASLRRQLNSNTQIIKDALRSAGWKLADNSSPLVGIVPASGQQAERMRRRLLRSGVYPSLVRYGHTPPPGAFRFAISSEHTELQLAALATGLGKPGE